MNASPLALHQPTASVETASAALLRSLRGFDQLLAAVVARFNALRGPVNTDPLSGLYISDEEVARLFETESVDIQAGSPIVERTDNSRLALLSRIFDLSAREADLLLIALAPALDIKYERIYGYLQDDMTRRRPTVEFALSLICPSREEKWEAHELLAASAPLLRNGLLHLLDDSQDREPILASRSLAVDERIVQFVLAQDEVDVRLQRFVRVVQPRRILDELVLPDNFRQRLARLKLNRNGTAFYFQGPEGAGKQAIAESLCHEWGQHTLLVIDGRKVPTSTDVFDDLVVLLRREAILQRALIFWKHADLLWSGPTGNEDKLRRPPGIARLLQPLAEVTPVLLAGEQSLPAVALPQGLRNLCIELPAASARERTQLWQRALTQLNPASELTRLDLDTVGGAFRLTPEQIRAAALAAPLLAAWRDAASGTIETADLHAACRLQTSSRLATLARKVPPHYRWDDLILPADRKQQLRELVRSDAFSYTGARTLGLR